MIPLPAHLTVKLTADVRGQRGFEIVDVRNGLIMDSGRGFELVGSVDDAVEVAKRRVLGMAPRAPDPSAISAGSLGVIQSVNSNRHRSIAA